MRRITTTQLAALVDQLSDRDHAILADLQRTLVLTGAHLQRLHFDHVNHNSRARDRCRVLDRLTQRGLVSTLDRRIGGVRAGSAGHVYTLTPAGRRYLALQRDQASPPRSRRFHTPSAPFLNHALAISDTYVSLTEASRHHEFQVATFTTEPVCWQPTETGRDLKPDAYTVLATPTYRDCWWLEIDRATESLPKISRKCRAYLDFLTHGGVGPHNVPPRILFTTPDTDRSNAIKKVITKLASPETQHVINVTTHADAPKFLITELFNP
ncbi:MAG: replication-relaxation family protein [Pseudonocardiales bacterium]|nr:replication-relaxation family protein [Pseudonocardiales bacterium]